MKYLLMIGLVTFVSCARNNEDVTRILEAEGCSNIYHKGANIVFDGCSKGDFYNNQFECIRNGKRVEGVVCSGLIIKAATVRYY